MGSWVASQRPRKQSNGFFLEVRDCINPNAKQRKGWASGSPSTQHLLQLTLPLQINLFPLAFCFFPVMTNNMQKD